MDSAATTAVAVEALDAPEAPAALQQKLQRPPDWRPVQPPCPTSTPTQAVAKTQFHSSFGAATVARRDDMPVIAGPPLRQLSADPPPLRGLPLADCLCLCPAPLSAGLAL